MKQLPMQLFKQHPGQQQVDLSVKIEIPGSFFGSGSAGSLTAGERKEKYEAIAMEYNGAHIFEPPSGRKPALIKPGIRAVFPADAADDASHPGFWIELTKWNRYRHDTYKDRPDDEVRGLCAAAARVSAVAAAARCFATCAFCQLTRARACALACALARRPRTSQGKRWSEPPRLWRCIRTRRRPRR